MDWLHRNSIGKNIAFILAVFLAWTIVSMAWYVCGVNDLCDGSKAAAEQEVFVEVTLADSQLPLPMAYDRAGAAADIFIMLMVAFVLGALLGRVLGMRSAPVPPLFSLPNGTPKEAVPERLGTPAHISEFIKKLPANAQKPTVTIMHASPKDAALDRKVVVEPPAPVYKPTFTSKPAPAPLPEKKQEVKLNTPIILGAAKTPEKPAFIPKPAAPIMQHKPMSPVVPAQKNASTPEKKSDQTERPKIRFNTSWNNPIRNEQKK